MSLNFLEDRSIGHPERLILSIYNCPDQFSLSIYNPEKRGSYFYHTVALRSHSDSFSAFRELLSDYPFFSLPFRKVWIMNRTPVFTFVPNPIYKDKYKDDFMQFLSWSRQSFTLNHSLSSAGFTIMYQIPEDIHRFMTRSFVKPEFIHYSAPLVNYFIKKLKKVRTNQMIVNLQENGIDIFCFSGNTFLLGNYFPCKDISQALFYILFTWKQLKLDQLNDCLHIAGNAVYRDDLIDRLASYIQQIHLLTISREQHFEGVETELIPFELAALSLCEL